MNKVLIRAWDKENQKMIYSTTDTEGFILYPEGTVQAYSFDTGCYVGTDDLIPMFWTGYRDKNGNLVWQDDIMMAVKRYQNNHSERAGFTDTVKWVRGGFKFLGYPVSEFKTKDDNETINYLRWCDHGHNTIPDIFYELVEFEVLGNVYENTELYSRLHDLVYWQEG